MNKQGKGILPSICPKCKKDANWEWGDHEFEGDSSWQDAVCTNCHSEFSEIMHVVSWEMLE